MASRAPGRVKASEEFLDSSSGMHYLTLRQMARPSDPEKRRELARRAADVLQREGLEIPVARLADALGVKRPTLLYHFPSYSHLVEAALEDLLTEQALFVLDRLQGVEDPLERLDVQVRAVHAFHHGREERIVFLTQAIAATAGPRLPEILATGGQVFAAHRQANVERLRAGIAEGTILPCDPEALVALVRAVLDGLLVQRMMTGADLGPVHDLIRDRLLEPLRARKRRNHAPVEAPSSRPRRKSPRRAGRAA
jgi:AcrR family transcriptional regulator